MFLVKILFITISIVYVNSNIVENEINSITNEPCSEAVKALCIHGGVCTIVANEKRNRHMCVLGTFVYFGTIPNELIVQISTSTTTTTVTKTVTTISSISQCFGLNNPCKNDAACFNLNGDKICICPEGFEGELLIFIER
jgi:hypothetical protein